MPSARAHKHLHHQAGSAAAVTRGGRRRYRLASHRCIATLATSGVWVGPSLRVCTWRTCRPCWPRAFAQFSTVRSTGTGTVQHCPTWKPPSLLCFRNRAHPAPVRYSTHCPSLTAYHLLCHNYKGNAAAVPTQTMHGNEMLRLSQASLPYSHSIAASAHDLLPATTRLWVAGSGQERVPSQEAWPHRRPAPTTSPPQPR